MKPAVSTSLLLVAIGCGTDRASTPPAAPAITGVNQLVHWDAQGSSHAVGESPEDVFIEVELPGDDVRPAMVADDGTFEIPDVAPTGPYWLRFIDGKAVRGDLYLWTDATEIDLGRDVVGTTTARATSASTFVQVDATGMAPWSIATGDWLMAGLGYWSAIDTFFAGNVPQPGETALSNLTYVWQGEPVTPSADPTFVELQPRHDDALAMDYNSPVKAFTPKPLGIADGATTHITGTFTDVPMVDIPVRWARSAFFAQVDAMHAPGCEQDLGLERYWVQALPGQGAHGALQLTGVNEFAGIVDSGPRVIDDVVLDGETDLNGTVHVGNPYPADWLYAKFSLIFDITCPLATGITPGGGVAEIGVLTTDLATAAVPLVGPVSAVEIAGRDLGVPQNAVGLDPTISWSPPALGTPTSYEIHISEVDRSGLGGFMIHEDAELIVPGDVTSITLPHDVLATGTIYELRIRAITRTGQQTTTAPFRSGMPVGYADFTTSFFEP